MTEISKKNKLKIQKIKITKENLTSRSGLIFFIKYLEQIKVFVLLIKYFKFFRRTKKGSSIKNIFKQLILYFIDGTYNQISGFNELKKDKGYSSVIETSPEDMCSSSTIKRFFEKFTFNLNWIYEKIIIELFIWRLKIENPKIIKLFVDTFVLKNESCQKREGVSWTYKKAMGYQPLNIIWNGFPILTILKPGKSHALSENTVREKIIKIVKIIRKRYSEEIEIIVKMDTGFLDEKLFKMLSDLNIYFVSVARWSKSTKETVNDIVNTLPLEKYENKKNSYSYTELGYKCKCWKTFYRAIYVELENKGEQLYLETFRDKTLIITNIKDYQNNKYSEELKKYFKAEEIIKLNHSRGHDELTHRGIKDFGTEKLPFQKFHQNAAFYYTMIISYFLFCCFKQDVLLKSNLIEIGTYATTIRRKIIDIAGKIVKTSGEIILKISESAYNFLNPNKLILNINASVKIRT